MPPTSRRGRIVSLIVALTVLAAGGLLAARRLTAKPKAREVRQALWDELRPVALKNCDLQRFGSKHDGGYLMCANLLDGVQAAYSYGIDTEDNWGCEVARRLRVPVQQYDCFTPHRPTCDGGTFIYHNECIGPKADTIDGRLFDSLARQIAKNGDDGKRLLIKIDIEGAEWESLLATDDAQLARVDQLPMELHGVNQARFTQVIQKLKRNFHLVSVHFNNWACSGASAPFPAIAYQVLFVNKRLGELDPAGTPRAPGSPPDAPDNPDAPDCQALAAR